MKIGTKITLSFFIITLLLTTLAISVVYVVERIDLGNAIFAHLASVSEARADHINGFLEMQKAIVRQLAASTILEEILSASKQDPDYAERLEEALKRMARTQAVNKGLFYECFALNADGKVIVSSDKSHLGLDRSENDYFLKAKEGIYIKDAYYSESTKKPTITFSAPIIDSETKEFLGVIVNKVNLSTLNAITTNRIGMGKTGETYLINRYGYMITTSRFIKKSFLKLKVDTVGTRKYFEDVKEFGITPHKHVPSIYKDYRGRNVLGIHRHISGIQWGVLAEIDENEAFMPLYRLSFVLFTLIVLAPILTWQVGRFAARLIADPIYQLRKGTEIIGQGNLDYKVGTEADDEIGELSRAFDRMTRDLKKSTTSIGSLQREVIERKKSEEKLQASENKYRTLLESLPQKIFFKDIKLNYISCNKNYAEDLKIKPGEIAGKTDYDFFPKELAKKYRRDDQKVIASGKMVELEEEYLQRGHKRIVRTIKLPVKDEKNDLLGILGIFWDITSRRKAEEKANEAVKIKSEFTSMVSHELRTPLTAIKEGIAIVLDGSAGSVNDEQKDFLDTAKRNVDRLARLINDVLDFQKLEAGRVDFNIEKDDLNEIVRNVQKEMGYLTKQKGLDFILNLDEKLPKASFDRDKIVQVLANLINNAVKFTDKGSITITTDREGNAVRVSVKDTGTGIAKEDMPKLFHKFEQLTKGTYRKTGGTGLGLAISKGIITGHKGKIWAESKPGRGATFYFILPIEERRS